MSDIMNILCGHASLRKGLWHVFGTLAMLSLALSCKKVEETIPERNPLQKSFIRQYHNSRWWMRSMVFDDMPVNALDLDHDGQALPALIDEFRRFGNFRPRIRNSEVWKGVLHAWPGGVSFFSSIPAQQDSSRLFPHSASMKADTVSVFSLDNYVLGILSEEGVPVWKATDLQGGYSYANHPVFFHGKLDRLAVVAFCADSIVVEWDAYTVYDFASETFLSGVLRVTYDPEPPKPETLP